ncbi:MAG: hypothetical protein NT049_02535 [Planctomycetota bacterium]|nr:hypothetical protein [Planctomycetota bacterium]
MKLGYAVLMLAVGAMLMFAPAAMGADKAEKGHGNAVYGVVTKLDPTEKPTKITVKSKTDEKTIDITADTKVVTGAKGEEKDATLADVKVDAHVAVTLDKDGKAAKIAIMPPHEKKAK